MASVLGISGLYHDAAAALVVDGEIRAAVHEERLSRVKNDPRLPIAAARQCLDLGAVAVESLDVVAFYERPFLRLERVMREVLRGFPRNFRQFPDAVRQQLGSKLWVIDQLAERLSVDKQRIVTLEHHHSHAACAFYTSPFQRACVLTLDGVGERASATLWRGTYASLEKLGEIAFPDSLGLFYSALTGYLGFEVNEGENKVMGLAAYGTPRSVDKLRKVIRFESDGRFRLALDYFCFHTDTQLGFSSELEALLGPRRPAGKPWEMGDASDRHYADVAFAVQHLTEEAIVNLARAAHRATSESALCLAGGVALNAVAMSKLQAETPFEQVFVPPPAGDAGGALGAAIQAAIDVGDPRPTPLVSTALGEAVDIGTLRTVAEHLGLRVVGQADPVTAWCDALARDEVVGFAQGRTEFGPRALGQRSMLANPERRETRERINGEIKGREWFRPLAPAVLAENATALFEDAPNLLTPFMTGVCRVKAPDRLRAVCHVDDTARVQTVAVLDGASPGPAPELRRLLEARAGRGEPPVVLNTSLNTAGQPLASGSEAVLEAFLSSSLDVLFAGDLSVRKPS